MRAIKAVVIGMGGLILVGFVVVGVTLVMRMQNVNAPRQAFQQVLTLPAGAQVLETRLEGGEIVLRVAKADGAEMLVLIDAADGIERGRIDLAFGP